MYTDVPSKVIEDLNPMGLRPYEMSYRMYAKLKKKIKTAQMGFDPFHPYDYSTPEERQRIQELSDALDFAYEHGQFEKVEGIEEELDRLIENVTTRTDELVTEGYDIEGAGVDKFE
jgi:SPX domain protein involved in polyphosphate accumulation